MRGFPLLFVLLAFGGLWGAFPPGAKAQTFKRTLTTYYDSARTQRRAVYGVQLRGTRPDTIPHGPYRRFWRSGSLEETGHFTEGLADSIWTRYYLAGAGQSATVSRRLPMRAGQPDGPFVVYHRNGCEAQRGTYQGGKLRDSLVTTGPAGQRRMLALFSDSSAKGLRGSFQQWGGRYTARSIARHHYVSNNNFYPATDRQRYWTGQLAAGRLVGAFTEHDADGQPRVRLSYTASGQWRMTTLYYPAAWLRFETNEYTGLPTDSTGKSWPAWQWQSVGQRHHASQWHWPYDNGTLSKLAEVKVFRLVPSDQHYFSGEIVGILQRPIRPWPTTARIAALPAPPPADQRPAECNGLAALYEANGRPRTLLAVVENADTPRRYPPISYYCHRLALQPMKHFSRWELGEADTTGATHRPARRLETLLPNGQHIVQTHRTTHSYYPNGRLEYYSHDRLLGGFIFRRFYEDGGQEEVDKSSLLDSTVQRWNAQGQMESNTRTGPVDLNFLRKNIRKKIKHLHPFRSVRQALRKFHPMQPIYRAVRRVFPHNDHHKPKPHSQ